MTDPNVPDGFVVTLKGGKGYDAPWIVVHAPTKAALDAQLAEVDVDLLTKVALFSETFKNLAAGGQASSQPAQQAVAQSAPPAASTPQPTQSTLRFHPEGKKCSACGGAMYYQEWESKQGKACKAYKCDGKGMGHDIDWTR